MSSSGRLRWSLLRPSGAARCEVELVLIAFRLGPPASLNDVDDLAKDPGLGMFPFAARPDICPSHEAIKQRKPITLKDVEADQIDIYLRTHKKRGAPDCLFCWLLP